MPDNWYQIGQDILGEDENDRSGKSLSLSDDGKILAIGAHYNSSVGMCVFIKITQDLGADRNDIDGEKK